MKDMRGNYFIKRYTEPLSIGFKLLYRPEEEISLPSGQFGEKSRVLDLCVAAEPCVTIVMLVELSDEGDNRIKRFYLYDTEEKSFRMLPYILEGAQPLQFAYRKEMLLLRYKERVDIVSVRSGGVVTVAKEALHAEAGDRVYLLDAQRERVAAYGYDGTHEEDISPPDSREIVAIDYAGELHFLTRDNEKLFLDSKECAGLDADSVDRFGWVEEKEFLFCNESGLFQYTQSGVFSVVRECDRFDVDCMKKVWSLENGTVSRFGRRRFYDEKLEQTLFFDSFKEDTVWNRLVLDAEIKEHTGVEIEVKSDSKIERFANAKDMLLYGHRGRKLTLTITLTGDAARTSSPQLYSVKTIFDATSYIDYMPALYKEEPETLHRFLSIFQTLSGDLEAEVGALWKMLDLELCDESFLSWLSGWLGLKRDYRWPERKWRRFLLKAPELYAMSGTKNGLKSILEIYTGAVSDTDSDTAPPILIEEYDGPGKYFLFCVRINPAYIDEEVDIDVIRAIVEEYKPAHTEAKVVLGYELDETPQIVVGKSVLQRNENEKE